MCVDCKICIPQRCASNINYIDNPILYRCIDNPNTKLAERFEKKLSNSKPTQKSGEIMNKTKENKEEKKGRIRKESKMN